MNNEKWLNTVVHLECATTSTDMRDPRLLELQEKLGRQYAAGAISIEKYIVLSRKLHGETRDHRWSGTAIFLKDDDEEHYLVTARHVIVDTLEMERWAKSDSDAFGWDANRKQYDLVAPAIFCVRRPGIDPRIGPSTLMMNVNATPFLPIPCTISSPELDLAIFSINRAFRQFLPTLLRLGYEPVGISEIANSPSAVGAQVTVVGFPGVVVNVRDEDLTATDANWTSRFISEPTSILGTVSDLQASTSTFDIQATLYHGNSGGPVIENDKVVGIAIQGVPSDEERNSSDSTRKSLDILPPE